MQETILTRLKSSRKELLDLGLRNPLLNYKIQKAKGLHIVQEKSALIFDILVRQNKAMTFLGRPGKDENDELPELTETEQAEAFNDTKLQTNEFDSKLQTKILNTYKNHSKKILLPVYMSFLKNGSSRTESKMPGL